MKKKLTFFLIILMQANMTAFAESAMIDPTLMTETLKQGIAVINATRTESQNMPSSDLAPAIGKTSELNDPTGMNQNFRDALTHANQLKAAIPDASNPLGKLAPDSNTPQITLLAHVQRKNQEKNRAVLRVNNKSEIVSAGDMITYFQGNEVMQINIVEITPNHVKIMLMPLNQTLILR